MKFSKILFAVLALTLAVTVSASAQDDQGGKKRHPSYNMIGRDAPPPESPLNPNFVVAEEARLSESGFWRSGYLNESLVGLDVADIDRDGQNEVVYGSARNIYVGRVAGEKLAQLAKYTLPTTEFAVSVDVLDLTGDGRQEVIVSAYNEQQTASSMILSFDGGELTPLTTKIPWYLRVVGSPGGRFLAGQKPGTGIADAFSGNVMRMSYSGGKVAGAGSAGIPPYINVFGFTLGRLGSGGLQMTAAIKFPTEHIFLFEGSNRAWESKEEYGGTMTYLDPPGTGGAESRNRIFLPARILLADIDGDGQNELIVAKNDRGGIPFMSGQRGFSSGVMQAFKYSNMSLTPFFRTRTLPGAGVDYQLADVNNNGTMDLVVAVVTEQKSGMMKEGRSVIVAYEIGGPVKPPAEGK